MPIALLPRWSGPILFSGMLIITWVHSKSLQDWAYADWAAVSAEFRQSLGLAGCFAAACSAWAGGSFASPRLAMCPAGAFRRGLPLVIHQLGELALWAVVGYGLGLAPLVSWTARNASYGGPQGWVVASALVSLMAFISGGYLVGVLVRSLLAVPIAGAMAFATVVFTGYNGLATSPVWPFDVVAGLKEPSGITAFRVVFFGTTVILCAGAAAWWMRERSTQLSLPPVLGVAVFIAPIILIGAFANHRAGVLVQRDLTAPTCERTSTGVNVCVAPARAKLLRPLALKVDEMSRAVGQAGLPFMTEVADATTWESPQQGRILLQIQGQSRERWLQDALADTAQVVSGVPQCRVDTGARSSGVSLAVSQAVAAWLLRQIHEPSDQVVSGPSAARLEKSLEAEAPEDVRKFFGSQFRAINACRGQGVQIP